MYYKQPRYYGNFKCSGSECTANCCFGWDIDWSREEVEKVINAPNCPAYLKETVEKNFVPKEECEDAYIVNLLEDGRCPCQTEEGLCCIQKEIGAEYLSNTCTVYPRYYAFLENEVIYRGCNLSCQEVVRLLVNNEKAADLVSVSTKNGPREVVVVYAKDKDTVKKYPELKYRDEIFQFYYELFANKAYPVETAIVFGALAAQKLTKIIADKNYDMIPDALKAFKKQFHDPSALRSVENIKPNYNIKFGVVDEIIEYALDFRMTDVFKDETGTLNMDRYFIGEAKLNEMMKDKPFWLRNIALSLLLETCLPFKSKERTVFENYSFFVAAIACYKLNAVAAAYAPEKLNIQTKGQTLHAEGIEKIYALTGIISRRILQTPVRFKRVLGVLKEFNINSPAYLALLVK